MPDVDLPDEALQDPIWFRSGGTERGRDACRIPVPWSGTEPSYGFSPGRDTWLPMPEGWAGADRGGAGGRSGVDAVAVPTALALRRVLAGVRRRGPGVVAGTRRMPGVPPARAGWCACSTSRAPPVPLPEGTVLLASADVAGGDLPDDAAAWLVA